MLIPDPDLPKLTENDKKVLRRIIDNAKTPDSEIAAELTISPQAVYKIRNKLENSGIIKGYAPTIDFRKLGIRILAIVIVQLRPEMWSKHTDDLISDRISRLPYVLSAYRIADANASHILVVGFRDIAQKEEFIARMQTKSGQDLMIKHVYAFSSEKIITQKPLGTLIDMIAMKDLSQFDAFPSSE